MSATPRFLPAGDRALVVEYGDTIDPGINARVRGVALLLEQAGRDGILELVPTYRSLMIHFDPQFLAADALERLVLEADSRLALGCAAASAHRGSADGVRRRGRARPGRRGGAREPPRGRGRGHPRRHRLSRLHDGLHAGVPVSGRHVGAYCRRRASERRAPSCLPGRSALPARKRASIRRTARVGGGSSAERRCACSTSRARRPP